MTLIVAEGAPVRCTLLAFRANATGKPLLHFLVGRVYRRGDGVDRRRGTGWTVDKKLCCSVWPVDIEVAVLVNGNKCELNIIQCINALHHLDEARVAN